MMSDASRLVRPGTAAQRSAVNTATRQYCQVAWWDYVVTSRCNVSHPAAGRPARACPLTGSSRVKGNFHARFLGGRGRVNCPRLPGAFYSHDNKTSNFYDELRERLSLLC